MFCNRCGRELPEGAAFCSVCGAPAPLGEDATGDVRQQHRHDPRRTGWPGTAPPPRRRPIAPPAPRPGCRPAADPATGRCPTPGAADAQRQHRARLPRLRRDRPVLQPDPHLRHRGSASSPSCSPRLIARRAAPAPLPRSARYAASSTSRSPPSSSILFMTVGCTTFAIVGNAALESAPHTESTESATGTAGNGTGGTTGTSEPATVELASSDTEDISHEVAAYLDPIFAQDSEAVDELTRARGRRVRRGLRVRAR